MSRRRVALGPVELVEAQTLGEGWLEVSRRIVSVGAVAEWEGAPTQELALLTPVVASPDPLDPVVAELGDPEWLAWMHDNFFVQRGVPELGGAASYAVRLFNYEGSGRDQIAWVVSRLRAN